MKKAILMNIVSENGFILENIDVLEMLSRKDIKQAKKANGHTKACSHTA